MDELRDKIAAELRAILKEHGVDHYDAEGNCGVETADRILAIPEIDEAIAFYRMERVTQFWIESTPPDHVPFKPRVR